MNALLSDMSHLARQWTKSRRSSRARRRLGCPSLQNQGGTPMPPTASRGTWSSTWKNSKASRSTRTARPSCRQETGSGSSHKPSSTWEDAHSRMVPVPTCVECIYAWLGGNRVHFRSGQGDIPCMGVSDISAELLGCCWTRSCRQKSSSPTVAW